MSGGLAHEIRNPLSTIRLNMELLAEELDDPRSPKERRARKRIEIVQQECERLSVLLDNFLDYAKVREAALEPSDLNNEIESIVDFFEAETRLANVEVQLLLDANLPRVLLDREQFRGAFFNLLLNAKQAMEHGGQLMIRTEPKGQGVAIYLVDTGCGMNETTASRMFEAFYSTKQGGSGLGLPTTQRIIAAHGGRISVQSEIGQGTQFMIELPALQQLHGE